MQICAIQKLTLLDYPGKVACTLFTKGCNFRCPWCHNASLVLKDRLQDKLSEHEVLDFLKKRFGILDGVAITGGEPLLNDGIVDFLAKIKEIGYMIKLDTNGSNPDLLKDVIEKKLVDRVAMDIKNSPSLYSVTVGCDIDIKVIEESKNFLLGSSVEYEFRTTVVKGLHTIESLIDAARWIAGAKEYYLQQFKDSGDLINKGSLSSFDNKEMVKFEEALKAYVPSVKVRGL